MFETLAIPGVFLYTPTRHRDDRGAFAETFNRAILEPLTGPLEWVQDNHSISAKNVLRGLHFQIPPFAQDKLIRCVRGAILDVAVDIRHGSPTFGQHVCVELSPENGAQLFVPKGFAHGFLAREAGTEIIYKVTNYYSSSHDRSIRWNDSALAIPWGIGQREVLLSEKDAGALELAQSAPYFRFP